MSSTTRCNPVALTRGCPCKGLTLAKLLRPAIMTILVHGAIHGYRVIEGVAASPVMQGSTPDPAGVYRTLRAMEHEGLVRSTWNTSGQGPAKRTYRLTAAGRTCLRRWVGTLETYRDAVGELLRSAKAALRTSRGIGRGPAR